mgnify:CR=1 FL=1
MYAPYPENMMESIKKVEATRAQRMATEPRRLSADEKDALLKKFHPDYNPDAFAEIKVGPNKGQKAPIELAEVLHSTSRLVNENVDINKIDYDVDVLVIGGGGIYLGSLNASAGGSQQLIVYNWGEYMDSDVIDIFEEETGIHVVYEEYETNEIMYPKIKSGAISYDLVCPSDYMIQKMIQNDLLQPINFDHIPNASNIGDMYYETSEQFDPGNLYSIPYCWGTVGILYNKKMVTEPIDSWSVLWDTNYRDSILMQDSVRDAFAVALKDLGYSLNSTNIKELTEAKDLLVTQKPLVQAYVVDQVRDKMIGNEAAIGVIYSGEAIYTKRENPDLEYVVPKEGSNVWIDSWCIPKDAQHVENAEKFLNFLCRPDIALKNFKYITYSTPNDAARELIEDDDIRNSEIAFPDEETLARCETFTYLGDDADEVYNQLWREVKSN